jgi:hypothetical protein
MTQNTSFLVITLENPTEVHVCSSAHSGDGFVVQHITTLGGVTHYGISIQAQGANQGWFDWDRVQAMVYYPATGGA